MDEWNITLQPSDSENGLLRKCRRSTIGLETSRSVTMNEASIMMNRACIGRW